MTCVCSLCRGERQAPPVPTQRTRTSVADLLKALGYSTDDEGIAKALASLAIYRGLS